MGHAIPKQHPAVVLRSHFNLVRALLGVAMVALVGLVIALVIVANDDNETTSAIQAAPATQLPAQTWPAYPTPEVVTPDAQLPAQKWPAYPTPEVVTPDRSFSGPAPTRKLDGSTDIPNTAPVAPGTRYDGGPDEGTRGIRQSGSAAQAYVNPSTGLPGTRYDGGPEEGSRGPLTSQVTPETRFDGGPEEGTRGPGSN
jgi:hypothetical protein